VGHVEYEFRPEVSSPVMVCAFAGWNDGGEAATTAARYLRDRFGARRFGRLDPEEFFDFQVNRPTVTLDAGMTRRLEWPTCELFHARRSERDLLLFIGVEPNLRWRTFCASILEVCSRLEVELLVTLGAYLADVPHSRPAPVTLASADPTWAARLGIATSTYEGPTGIVGVLNEAAAAIGLPAVSMWAAAPHYLPSDANPRVALALLERLRDLLGVELDTAEVEAAARVWDERVRRAIEGDPNLAAYVRRLEEAAAEEEIAPPDGEELVRELERFLRDQRDES
jgi:proteasome assembly chaperone (PAC2) family protein